MMLMDTFLLADSVIKKLKTVQEETSMTYQNVYNVILDITLTILIKNVTLAYLVAKFTSVDQIVNNVQHKHIFFIIGNVMP